ncbi:coniferyl aldehyde dehydrogenase [Roseisolibacter agri]|uniref:Aldehyde dehydrogenase n=1 Tax=Roseisolibacter agri TaxID=2014610 RepID=A0AA37QK88_9BACT|nr:coniferyl aldehyde dehydrogenase [Roseisolibacter agri]GLC28443.1 aldehyde dehydrogenase [Roseisolibacter agri]
MTETAAGLAALLETQRAAFARGAPDHDRRIAALDTLRDALREHQDALVDAVSEDFGGRAAEETLLLELFPLLAEIAHARRHLKRWMRPRTVRPAWYLLPGRARVVWQPLGVVGVMSAWNYQLLLSLSPLVGALAAGNHVIVKPSEVTPRTADLIARIVAERFPREYVAGVTGDADVAAAFSALPFDHLIFTGSTRVGKLVMRAASEHLVPVTLELGGKSPVILHRDAPLARAADRIVTGKLYNAGQTCVAPDYALVPRDRVDAFVQEVRRASAARYPRLVATRDYTRIVTRRHWERLQALVDDARARGARVQTVDPASEAFTPENRVFPPTLVLDASDAMSVMQEEIFGPVLPVVPYDTLDDAIAYVNARPRPLALYYFDDDRRRIDDVLARTTSGTVAVNDVVVQLGVNDLPFGGVGPSGMGQYHGFDGFQTFSKKKGVFLQSRFGGAGLLAPPYTGRTRALIRRLLRMT